MTKRIASILIALLMQLNGLFGFFGAVVDPAQPADAYYDPDTVVDVIVELRENSLLDAVHNSSERDALVDSIETNPQYQKMQKAQTKLREQIQKKFQDADLSDSYSYSFVTNGISLSIPYRFVSALKKLSGVKDVTVSAVYSAPDTVLPLDMDNAYSTADAFTGIR